MKLTYRISDDDKSIKCLRCGRWSHNQNDVTMRYCGYCHDFHSMCRCDFCMAPEVELVHTYYVKSKTRIEGLLKYLDVTVLDTGEWMACRECYELISAERWKDLIDRGCGGIVTMYPNEQVENLQEKVAELLQYVFGEI